MVEEKQLKFRTRAIHVGNSADEQTGAVVRPLHVASTFVQKTPGEWGPYDYTRSGNPTRDATESTIASLEGGSQALAFSTGMAATHCVTMLLNAGDHVVAGTDIYGGTYRLFHKICNRAGIEVSLANSSSPGALASAIRPQTKLIWIESPGNPLMSITDIAACAKVATEHGVLLGVDNTFATPVLTQPLSLGADIVMHSATKYLGGHSDANGGLLVVDNDDLYDKLYFIHNSVGNCMSVWDSYLITRGIKTLELRVHEQCRTAMLVAEYLQQHPKVKRVLYPGLASHEGYDIAKRQMNGGFGAMLSFEVDADYDLTKNVVGSTRLFQLAVSLGAVESLISQPASMSHASYDREDRIANGIHDELIRLSVGLEHVEDLVADLDQALRNL
ncbi:MAG: PLP-dependent transferase [Planctomycetaceae bacterium]|jgi:cystathionine gamma-lyase|nr:PLP-dependent transferase [Planctomycetaceae bacterium]MBT5883481.1 PLP-dependent transferase [Planctomycetaceae bacterium]MBT6847609.1 PLP-dependent transferase [Planctomycetaceae bacterium]